MCNLFSLSKKISLQKELKFEVYLIKSLPKNYKKSQLLFVFLLWDKSNSYFCLDIYVSNLIVSWQWTIESNGLERSVNIVYYSIKY